MIEIEKPTPAPHGYLQDSYRKYNDTDKLKEMYPGARALAVVGGNVMEQAESIDALRKKMQENHSGIPYTTVSL